MTPKTLTKERREKFENIIVQWLSTSPAITDVTGDGELLDAEIKRLAGVLADAAESRSERKTDEERPAYRVKGIEAAMFQGRSVEDDDLPQWQNREVSACNAFESAFGIERPWNWYPAKGSTEKEWKDLRAYLVQLHEADPACFTGYAKWASDKYSRGAKNASQIRQDPGCFPTAWAAYKASGMYVNPTSQSTTYTDDEGIPLT